MRMNHIPNLDGYRIVWKILTCNRRTITGTDTGFGYIVIRTATHIIRRREVSRRSGVDEAIG